MQTKNYFIWKHFTRIKYSIKSVNQPIFLRKSILIKIQQVLYLMFLFLGGLLKAKARGMGGFLCVCFFCPFQTRFFFSLTNTFTYSGYQWSYTTDMQNSMQKPFFFLLCYQCKTIKLIENSLNWTYSHIVNGSPSSIHSLRLN